MRMFRKFTLGFAALGLAVATATPLRALDNDPDRVPTVGEFLASYAKTLNVQLPADASPTTVCEALRVSGVKLDSTMDFTKPLTQADVVKIGKANGLNVTTHHPVQSFTARETNQFFVTYGMVLGRTTGAALHAAYTPRARAAYASSEGKNAGKGKKHHSPHEPNDHGDGHVDHGNDHGR